MRMHSREGLRHQDMVILANGEITECNGCPHWAPQLHEIEKPASRLGGGAKRADLKSAVGRRSTALRVRFLGGGVKPDEA